MGVGRSWRSIRHIVAREHLLWLVSRASKRTGIAKSVILWQMVADHSELPVARAVELASRPRLSDSVYFE